MQQSKTIDLKNLQGQ